MMRIAPRTGGPAARWASDEPNRRGLRSFGAFWWDFIVGDDWRIAAGVVVGTGGDQGRGEQRRAGVVARSGGRGWAARDVIAPRYPPQVLSPLPAVVSASAWMRASATVAMLATSAETSSSNETQRARPDLFVQQRQT